MDRDNRESDEGKRRIIEAIIDDAHSEANEIIEKAEKEAERKRKSCQRLIRSLDMEQKNHLRERLDEIESSARSRVNREIARIELGHRNNIHKRVLDEIEKELLKRVDSADYATILEEWIVEGVLGVDVAEAVVNGGETERHLITPELLARVQKRAEQVSRRPTHTALSSAAPLSEPGVMVTSLNGAIGYSNQIKERLRRFEAEMGRFIHERLIALPSDSK